MKKALLWIFAIVLTLSAAYYQRKTGPTNPKDIQVTLADRTYTVTLLRSSGARPARIVLPVTDTTIQAKLFYKRLGVAEDWIVEKFAWKEIRYHSKFMKKVMGKEDGTALAASLPVQPPAGKLEYFIEMQKSEEVIQIAKDNPVVIRFKGDVPALALIPHIILMFLGMLFASVAGLFAAFRLERYKRYTIWTFIILFAGGFIFGPLVQWFAFGDWWTGIPFGWDLTDNKTLFAFLFWIAALFGIKGKGRPWLVILAAIMTLIIFSIPHSLFGSTLDYSTGSVIQG
ncbi:MAG: hypothetical protein M0P69_07085 [Bacteroidales bacterium]|jgi:hypothetical protein|nr:hypothetical protein [Bacteroidales bacterium]MDD2570292.1 hypothetical protein [Bacteroidales bacterium]MDD3385356.1 hypothetical protein [Bacteroidales bacterium]MDD4812541.1 hypothetical protein [Bacteroidales bacterium]